MAERSNSRRAPELTREHSFEQHRTGGRVEAAPPEDLARQREEAEEFTPVGAPGDIRRALWLGAVCGVVLAVILGLVGWLAFDFMATWSRIGLFAVIGLLGGVVYGAVLGAAARAR